MSQCKGIASVCLFFLLSTLLGCSGNDGGKPVETDFSITQQLDYAGLDLPANLNQLIVSNAVLDYLTFYEIAHAFVDQHYLITEALHGSIVFKPKVDCEDQGYVSIASTKENNDWRVMFSYSNCREGGVTLNGKIIYSYPDSLNWVSSDGFSVYFEHYYMGSFSGESISLHGRVTAVDTFSPNELQIDLTATDTNGQSVKSDNLKVSSRYNEHEFGAYSGRIYYSELGYVEIEATNGFEYDETSSWPVQGGQLKLSGVDSEAHVSIEPNEKVWLEIQRAGELTEASLLNWTDLDIDALPDYGEKPIALVSNQKFDYTNLGEAESIDLDATASSDPENKLLTYEWSIVNGPEGHSAHIANPLSPRPTFYPDRMGTYDIQLIVSDGLNKSDAFVSKVVLDSGQYRARARMTRHQELPGVKYGRLFAQVPIHFDASTSQMMVYPDAFEFINLTYKWRVVSGPEGAITRFTDPLSEKTDFISDIGGTYVIGLVVNDGQNDSVEEELLIRLENYSSYAPYIRLYTLPFGYIDEQVSLKVRADSMFGPDANKSEWTLVSSPENSLATIEDINGLVMSFRTNTPGKYVFRVVAATEYAQSEAAEIILYVDEAPLFEIETLISSYAFSAGDQHKMPVGLAIYDANKDGKEDIVFPVGSIHSNGAYNEVWFLHQDTNQGGFESQAQMVAFEEYQYGIFKVAGFSSSNANEVFTSKSTIFKAFELSEDGNLSLSWSLEDPFGVRYQNDQVLVKDLDNNSFADFVTLTPPNVVDSIARQLRVYRNKGDTSISFEDAQIFSLDANYGWYDIKSADVRGDGHDDLLVTSYNWQPSVPGTLDEFVDISKMLYFEMGADGTYESPVELNLEGFPGYAINNSPQFDDIDGDGDLDIAGIVSTTQFTHSGGIGYWLQDGDGDFKRGELLLNNPWTGFTVSVRSDAQSLRLADLNNDGLKDIVLLNQNNVSVFFQTSAGEFNIGQNYQVAKDYSYQASFAEASDIDKDGDIDIIVSISDSTGPRIVQLTNRFIH